MAYLDLQSLPLELQAVLERVWPGCAEAQRRAVLGPWCNMGWVTVWPGGIWPWQPAKRWWRPGSASQWRERFEAYFSAQCHNELVPEGPRLFDPDQPFFPSPWTQTRVLLRSPAPEAFTDAEFWSVTTQLFGGDAERAASQVQGWARSLEARGITGRGHQRDSWWQEMRTVLHAEATGSLGSL
jgi:hypothetical protein